ncbi:MAG: MFS transporter [Alphaproteobacteria bacterium]|nr:MFS transporter [Alphaproteobacteria bacterium]
MSETTAAGAPANPAEEEAYPPPALAWAMVAVLFLAYILSFIDRMIIGLLVEPLKADLGLSDTQVSLLQGFAFALFYTIVGLPIGRMIDRSARLPIIAGGVALWSFMTAVCGMATQYWHLFLARMGVGVGEATLSPAAYSIIPDLFPKRRLGLAMGIYGLGSAAGAGLAFLIGAAVIRLISESGSVTLPILGELRAWQATFFIVGLPGLLVAGLIMLMPEPVRRGASAPGGRDIASISAVIEFTFRKAGSVLGLCFAVAMVNFAVFAAVSWLPVLLIRVHGFDLSGAGNLAGGALILGGLIGLVGGGALTDRIGGGLPQGRLAFCGFAAIVGTVFAVIFPLVSSPWMAAAAFVIFFASAAVPIGAAASALQQLTPNRMRATVSAIYLFIVNLIGLGAGPTATALVGDTFFPGGDGIRYAIAWVSPFAFAIAALLFFLSARYAAREQVH